MSVVIVSSYDEKLGQMVSRKVYLSDDATCVLCAKEANKKDFPYYGYDFDKKKYTGWCNDCLAKMRSLHKSESALPSAVNKRLIECVCCGRKMRMPAFMRLNFAGNSELGMCVMCYHGNVPLRREYASAGELPNE